jgi:hypothetical protein
MTNETAITLSYPGSSVPDFETTWGGFAAQNDDAEMLADVERQIAEHNYASIGGGAAPEIWVFA